MSKTDVIEREPMNQEGVRTEPIGENTPVRLSVMVGCIAGIVGLLVGAAGAIYWGGGVTAKLDLLLNQVSNMTSRADGLEKEIRDHKTEDQNKWTAMDTRLSIVEQTGSKKTQELEKRLNEIEMKQKIHEAGVRDPKP